MQIDGNARMNWFERHLNWTALGMAVGSIAVTIFLFIFSNGVNVLDIRGNGFRLSITLLVTLVMLACYTISAIGYGWILHRKKRSLFFLLFFLPGVFQILFFFFKFTTFFTYAFSGYTVPLATISITPQIFTLASTNVDRINPLPVTILLNIFFLAIAWFILILLDDKHRKANPAGVTSGLPVEKNTNFLSRFFSSGKKVLYALLTTLLLSVLLSSGSFLNLNYGSSTFKYHPPDSGNDEAPIPQITTFSFRYPSHFSKPRPPRLEENVSIEKTTIKRVVFYTYDQLFFNDDSSISVHIYSQADTNILKEYFGTTKDGFINYTTSRFGDIETGLTASVSSNFTSLVDVCGVAARQQTFPPVVPRYIWGFDATVISVDFIYNDALWVIIWCDWYSTGDQPPPYFTHLLETFKIYDD
jgi:hypothetical protein